MDLRKEDEDAAKLPRELAPPGAPSILYFIDNIPADAEKLKFVVISHFQKRKRFKGGEVVEREYKALGPNSALLLFENAEGNSLCPWYLFTFICEDYIFHLLSRLLCIVWSRVYESMFVFECKIV